MTRIVLDTNVIVSAMLRPDGNEAAVLQLVADGRAILCATPAILAEYEEVLFRPKFRLDRQRVQRLLAALHTVNSRELLTLIGQ